MRRLALVVLCALALPACHVPFITEGCTPYGCLPDGPPPTVDPNTGRTYPQPTPGPEFDPNTPDPNAPPQSAPPVVPGPAGFDPNEPPQVETGQPPAPPSVQTATGVGGAP